MILVDTRENRKSNSFKGTKKARGDRKGIEFNLDEKEEFCFVEGRGPSPMNQIIYEDSFYSFVLLYENNKYPSRLVPFYRSK